MFISKRRLGLSVLALGGALGFALASAPKADALTISFTLQAYTKSARFDSLGYTVQGGIPIAAAPFDTEALQVFYQTSTAPYFLQSITYHSTGNTSFAAGGVTNPSVAPPFASGVPGALTYVDLPGTLNGRIRQTFTEATPFAEGQNNGEFTYVEIDGPGGEMAGGLNGSPPFVNGNTLLPFNGAQIDLVFERTAAGDPSLPFNLTATANFGVQATPPVGDPLTLNYASTGGNITVPNAVPEPGMVALFLGMGISGSGLLLRRRIRR